MKMISFDRTVGLGLAASFLGLMIAAGFTETAPEICHNSSFTDGIATVFLVAWSGFTAFVAIHLITRPS